MLRTAPLSKWNAGLLRALQLDSIVYDFWKEAQPGLSAEIMASEEHIKELKSFLHEHEIEFQIKVEDVDE